MGILFFLCYCEWSIFPLCLLISYWWYSEKLMVWAYIYLYLPIYWIFLLVLIIFPFILFDYLSRQPYHLPVMLILFLIFIPLLFLIPMIKTSRKILVSDNDRSHPYFVLELNGNLSSTSLLHLMIDFCLW